VQSQKEIKQRYECRKLHRELLSDKQTFLFIS
jgi:hypothetical protein